MTIFNQTYDVVVAGTGAAGFATALGAADKGLKVLMLESTAKWGGNTSMSGGGMWLPDNPLMRRATWAAPSQSHRRPAPRWS